MIAFLISCTQAFTKSFCIFGEVIWKFPEHFYQAHLQLGDPCFVPSHHL
jgi:hypothetical protein